MRKIVRIVGAGSMDSFSDEEVEGIIVTPVPVLNTLGPFSLDDEGPRGSWFGTCEVLVGNGFFNRGEHVIFADVYVQEWT